MGWREGEGEVSLNQRDAVGGKVLTMGPHATCFLYILLESANFRRGEQGGDSRWGTLPREEDQRKMGWVKMKGMRSQRGDSRHSLENKKR